MTSNIIGCALPHVSHQTKGKLRHGFLFRALFHARIIEESRKTRLASSVTSTGFASWRGEMGLVGAHGAQSSSASRSTAATAVRPRCAGW
jgi:hypothetical protein